MERVKKVFAQAEPGLPRVLVVHHNVLRGEMSQRMGLARWKRAQRRIIEAGTDVVLCGHDHQEGAETLDAEWPFRRRARSRLGRAVGGPSPSTSSRSIRRLCR